MRSLLLVDDDPFILKVYQMGLSRSGFDVRTASDGLTAIASLRERKPDVVVLDLMMPRLNGVDVLKFIRSQSGFVGLPVIVLSNSYMNDVAAMAARHGPEKALLKVRCTPALLVGEINAILAGDTGTADRSELLAAPSAEPGQPAAGVGSVPELAPQAEAKGEIPISIQAAAAATISRSRLREEFLSGGSSSSAVLRDLLKPIAAASNDSARLVGLQALYRKVHFLNAAAGLADLHVVAALTTPLEAVLFEVTIHQSLISASVLRTVDCAVNRLCALLEHPDLPTIKSPASARVLVVGNEPGSAQLTVPALQRASLQADCVKDPESALKAAFETHYDLLVIDMDLPMMTGFEVCEQIRELPGCGGIPVIYTIGRQGFNDFVRQTLLDGDVISKPLFPVELALKAVLRTFFR
jgi:CheY-like chemotaxis protein